MLPDEAKVFLFQRGIIEVIEIVNNANCLASL